MKLKHTLISMSVLAGFGFSPSAHAIWPVTDAALIQLVTQNAQQDMQANSQNTQSIVRELQKLQAGQDAASNKISETVSQSTDNAIKRNVDVQQQNQIQEAGRNTRTPIDPCANAAAGLSGPSGGGKNQGVAGGGLGPGGSAQVKSSGSAMLDKVMKIAKGDAPAPSPETQASLAQAGACEAYAYGERARACKASGVKTANNTDLPNADISAASLLDGAQSVAKSGQTSLTFTEEQVTAAVAYLRNVSNPISLRDLTPSESKTDDGRRFLALRDAHKARLEMSVRPANEWLGKRMANKELTPVVQTMLDGGGAAAKYLQATLAKQAPDWKTKGISSHNLMYIETSRRYRNPDWALEIAATSDPLTLQREQLALLALNADIARQQLFEQEKTNIFLGSVYQSTLNADFMPELIAQHRKAISAPR